jgi:hypothetical protein
MALDVRPLFVGAGHAAKGTRAKARLA